MVFAVEARGTMRPFGWPRWLPPSGGGPSSDGRSAQSPLQSHANALAFSLNGVLCAFLRRCSTKRERAPFTVHYAESMVARAGSGNKSTT